MISWPDLGHGKDHPAIVLKRLDRHLILAEGTSKWHLSIGVTVPWPSPKATMLGLRRETHFYARNLLIVDESVVQPGRAMCPPDLFAELLRMLEQNARHLLLAATRDPAEQRDNSSP